MALTRRLQILLDDERYRRLEAESKRTGASVGEVVRRAIDARLAGGIDLERRRRAGESLLAAPMPPGDGPEPDWEEVKNDLLDQRWRRMYPDEPE